jgi:hypothetical protein
MFALAQSGCGFSDFLNLHPHLLSFFMKDFIRWFWPLLFMVANQCHGQEILNVITIDPAFIFFEKTPFFLHERLYSMPKSSRNNRHLHLTSSILY